MPKKVAKQSVNGECKLAPYVDAKCKFINVVIETPRGNRNKFKYDDELHCFRLGSVLPAGATFPYDFGFVPGTKAADGDPIDVLLLMDESAFPGCLVCARLIGVIEAEQIEGKKKIRNDRLIAVATDAHDYRDVRSLDDINSNLLEELEHFFASYNEMRGKVYKLLGGRGPKQARKLLERAIKNHGR
ncbi:MAG TPA: inorganic diphosphatase [Pirellulales bacterium]|jgi:inorganic pyrophosphatase|nr:inorganic diphosphatase [Pirellulales bacterium]